MISSVYANGAVVVIMQQQQQQQNNAKADSMREKCDMPTSFASEKTCTLKYVSRTTWTKFYCDTEENRYYISADCEGKITSSRYETWKQINEKNEFFLKVFALLLLIIFIIILVVSLTRKLLKGRKDE